MLWNTGIYTTSHPTEIAAIDNESVSCRNSCFHPSGTDGRKDCGAPI